VRLQALVDRTHVVRRVLVKLRRHTRIIHHTVLSVFRARVVVNGKGTGCDPSDLPLNTEKVLSGLHANVTHFAPVLPPRVANDPVLGIGILVVAPTRNRNDVVGALRVRVVREDTTLVADNGFR